MPASAGLSVGPLVVRALGVADLENVRAVTLTVEAGRPPQAAKGVSINPSVPAYPVARFSSLSGRVDLALGLRAGGVFLHA